MAKFPLSGAKKKTFIPPPSLLNCVLRPYELQGHPERKPSLTEKGRGGGEGSKRESFFFSPHNLSRVTC